MPTLGAGFQPFGAFRVTTWAVGPGWYEPRRWRSAHTVAFVSSLSNEPGLASPEAGDRPIYRLQCRELPSSETGAGEKAVQLLVGEHEVSGAPLERDGCRTGFFGSIETASETPTASFIPVRATPWV